MAFQWAAGSRVKADAEVVGARLDELTKRNNNRITPRVVVDDARPDESPMHPCFEWDDIRAAELFREDQARHVLRSIRVVHEDDNRGEVVHAYVSMHEKTDGGKASSSYVPIALALSDASLREQLIRQAMKELEAFQRKYQAIVALASVFSDARDKAEGLLLGRTAA